MSLYQINERETLAALDMHLARRKYHGHTVEQMLTRIHQHPAAMLQSAVEMALTEACPNCLAAPGEECRPDCSSWF